MSQPKSPGAPPTNGASVRSVAIVGCGLMGVGIAEVCARAGIRTTAVAATRASPGAVRKRFEESLAKQVKKGKLDEAARDHAQSFLDVSSDLDAVSGADLVLETVLESMPAKQSLFRRLEKVADDHAILATNTSSFSLRAVAAQLGRPDRFLGLHFFSPAQTMKLCEVAPMTATSDRVVAATVAFASALGKTPVVVGDAPGYVVNRLLVPYLLLAMHMLEDGVATQESIDAAMKLGCGHPLGPLALADRIGLDVVMATAMSLDDEYGGERYLPPPVLGRLVSANYLGKKTGAGFYLYGSGTPMPNPVAAAFIRERPSSRLVA